MLLKEKITGLPQVDAITLIDANGNSSTSSLLPIPNVNVSDRDYFIALKTDPDLETFVSKPVLNRGSGTWNIYIARRLNNPDGKFMGLILGAISVQFFENFFGATSLATNTVVSLDRQDGVLLAHYPPSKNLGGPSTGAGQRALAAGGNIRELSPEDKKMRIRSARMLPQFANSDSCVPEGGQRAGGLAQPGTAADRDVVGEHRAHIRCSIRDRALVEETTAIG